MRRSRGLALAIVGALAIGVAGVWIATREPVGKVHPTQAELLDRVARVLAYWSTRADPATGLTPNFLPEYRFGKPKGPNADRPLYAPADSGADLYPFQVIAAWLAAPSAGDQPLVAVLEAQRRFAEGPDRLQAEWVDLRDGARGPSSIFAGAEYAKDGLLSVTGLLGDSPWSERMTEVIDGIAAHASVPSAFGDLPGTGAEVHGDLLQVLVPLLWKTGEARYAELARRIADAYVREVLPNNHGLPSQEWDFTRHRGNGVTHLRDHGNEIISGLVLYVAWLHERDPAAAREYVAVMRTMIDRVLASANRDGLLYNHIDSDTLRPVKGRKDAGRLTDNWGYVYGAVYNLYLLTGDEQYRAATRRVLEHLPGSLGHDWSTYPGHDDWADTIESAIYLIAREDVPEAREWLAAMVPKLVRFQQDDGMVGGSYLDGNFMRTLMLYALHLSRGVIARPWRTGLGVAAHENGDGDGLRVEVTADTPWRGAIAFDTPRHRRIFHMTVPYVRLNEWPEWWVVEDDARYEVRWDDGRVEVLEGRALARGLPVEAPTGLTVRAAQGPR